MNSLFTTPILFLIFNRPEETAKSWPIIKKLKPATLYVAADGPRLSNKNDKQLCEQARKIVTQSIDWDCTLHLLFREENLGCGRAVSSAISWFFQNVTEGIILEDDCLPHPDFFPYCSDLLERYRHENSVFMISGTGLPESFNIKINYDYYFTNIPSAWGWATWRRSWEKYDFNMNGLNNFVKNKSIEHIFSDKHHQQYWLKYFNEIRNRHINNWDYQLVFAIFNENGLCIRPSYNLVENIGTTLVSGDKPLSPAIKSLKIKNHPNKITANKIADKIIIQSLISPTYKFKNILKKIGLFYKLKKLYQRL